MAEILGAATTATKYFLEVNQITIDNATFKLFYKATTTLLLACSLLTSSKQFFGDPINCEVDWTNGGAVNEAVLNSYCWMYSSFNIPLNFKGACIKRENDGSALYNSYYQWVSLYLVISALMFYAPRGLWLMLEGGLMKFLAKGATEKIVEDADEKRESLIKTFHDHLHNKYNAYAAWFLCCEQLNFTTVLCQWFITNRFLKYQFIRYGPAVIHYYNLPPEERSLTQGFNPMCEAFPRIASCNYVRYGTGGMQEVRSAICILGLNMINDKIFLVLWFWYGFLTIFGVSRLIYRIVQCSSSKLRYFIIRMHIHRYFHAHGHMRHVEHYINKCSYGDWFVLYQMSRNMNRRFFAEFLTLLSRRVNPDPEVDEDAIEEEEDIVNPLLKKSIDLNNSISKLPMKGEGGLSRFGKKKPFKHHFTFKSV